jgi:hypothetical protein
MEGDLELADLLLKTKETVPEKDAIDRLYLERILNDERKT